MGYRQKEARPPAHLLLLTCIQRTRPSRWEGIRRLHRGWEMWLPSCGPWAIPRESDLLRDRQQHLLRSRKSSAGGTGNPLRDSIQRFQGSFQSVCTHMHEHTHIYTHMYILTHTQTHTRSHTHVHTHTLTHMPPTHTHTDTHADTLSHTCSHTLTYSHTQAPSHTETHIHGLNFCLV